MKKLNKTELEVVTKKIIEGIAQKYRDEEQAFLKENAESINHWENLTVIDILKNPCLYAYLIEGRPDGTLEKTSESLAIKHVKKIKGYVWKSAPYSSEVFNALILAQIECSNLETLIQKVSESFTKG